MTRIAINGFGRIGRYVVRAALSNPAVQIVGINDLFDANMMAHLLKYDSIFGPLSEDVSVDNGKLCVGNLAIPVTSERDPAALPWKQQEVDVVFECTGVFTSKTAAAPHLEAGAQRVVVSAPAKDVDLTVVYGVNHTDFDASKHTVISNASCTTNCLAPIAKVLDEQFGIESGFMTTIHSYTNDQRLMDAPHKDMRRARAAALSMIPTSTGAARAVGLVLPQLQGKLDGMAIRVPTPNVSCLDLTAVLSKSADVNAVNGALRDAANGPLKGVLRYCDEPLVSADFLGDAHSSIVDADSTAVNGNLVKILAWYDNEAGFSNRLLDVAKYIS